jgi:hypothetical protein
MDKLDTIARLGRVFFGSSLVAFGVGNRRSRAPTPITIALTGTVERAHPSPK